MKAIDLAIQAGRLRQSPLTRWIHHSTDHPDHSQEMIPVYENFCFALALFRAKTAETILEGKAFLERLFAFQTPQGFPLYLHEYPICHSRRLMHKLAPIAYFLLRDFNSVLGEELRTQLQGLLPFLHRHPEPKTPAEWADVLIHTQITGEGQEAAFQWWDSNALCFTGPQNQDREEPEVTLLDLIMGEWTGHYSKRALLNHPAQLQASLIYPSSQPIVLNRVKKSWARRFWGTDPTHSALLQTQGSWSEENGAILVDLPAKDVVDEVEISYFLNRHPNTKLSIGGVPSTTFQFGESVIIQSDGAQFKMIFTPIEGNGRFWGHLYFGNRPRQVGCRGSLKYEAFDWHIALRTIQRTERCVIRIDFQTIDF